MREDEEQNSKIRLGSPAAALPGLAAGMDLLAFARYLQSERDAPAPRSEAAQARTSDTGGSKEPFRTDALGRADLHDNAEAAFTDFFGFASSTARSGTASAAANGGATQLVAPAARAPLSAEDIIKMVGSLPSIWNVASSPMPNLHTASPETDAWFSSRINVPQPSPAPSTARSSTRSSDEVTPFVANSELSAVASRSGTTAFEESGDNELSSASANTTIIQDASNALNLQVASSTSTSVGDAMRLSSSSIGSAVGAKLAGNVQHQSAVTNLPPVAQSSKSDATFGTTNAGLIPGDVTSKTLHGVMAQIGPVNVVSVPASTGSGTSASPYDALPAVPVETRPPEPASLNLTEEVPQASILPIDLPTLPPEPITQVPALDLAIPSEPAPPLVPPIPPTEPSVLAPVVVEDNQIDPSVGDPSVEEAGTQPIPAAVDVPAALVVVSEGTAPQPKLPSQTAVEVGNAAGQPPSSDVPPDDIRSPQPVVSEQVATGGLSADEPISNVDVEYPLPGPGPSPGFAAFLLAQLNETPSPTVETPPLLDSAVSGESVPQVSAVITADIEPTAEAIVGFGTDDLPSAQSMSAVLHDTTFTTVPPIFDPGLISDT